MAVHEPGPDVLWNLFIDESGDFDRLDDRVAVVAVGLRVDHVLCRPDQLRRQLERLVPGLPWPMHLCVAKRSSVHVLGPLLLRRRAIDEAAHRARAHLRACLEAVSEDRALEPGLVASLKTLLEEVSGASVSVEPLIARHAPAWGSLIERPDRGRGDPLLDLCLDDAWTPAPSAAPLVAAARHLAALAPGLVEQVLEAFLRREDPCYEDLEHLDALLRGDRCWPLVGSMVAHLLAAFRAIVKALARPDDTGLPGLMVWFASESRKGDFHPPGDGRDRYLSLLEALLVRVGESLGHLGRSHVVRLCACTRQVVDPLLPSSVRVPLMVRHLAALAGPVSEASRGHVRLVPFDTPRYRDTQDPGFVFVDFFASVCREAVGERPLRRVEELVLRDGGARPRSGDPGLTHAQAAGAAWRLTQALRSGRSDTQADMWPWAREQALEWGAHG